MPNIKQEISPIPETQNPLDMAVWSEKTSGDLRTDLHALKHEDSTFSGAMEIDGSTDISTALYVDGSQDVLNTLGCLSDAAVVGDFSVDGTLAVGADASFDGTVDFGDGAAFGAEVSIDGVLKVDSSTDFSDVFVAGDLSVAGTLKVATDFTLTGDMAVDGTSNFNDAVGISDAHITGDVSCTQAIAAWVKADFTTNTIHANYNVAGVDWTNDGRVCVSFSNALASANYAINLTGLNIEGGGVGQVLYCSSQHSTGFRIKQSDAGGYTNDQTEFYAIVVI